MMEVCEQPADPMETPQITNYQDFETYTGDLFEKVYNEEFVHGYKFSPKNPLNEDNASLKLRED